MSAVDPNGDQKYFINGMVFEGLKNSVADTGTLKFFLNGMAEENLFPPCVRDDFMLWLE